MSRARGRRYDEKPKLNIKKVLATIIAIAVLIMFISSLRNLLSKPRAPEEVSTVTTYFTVFSNNKWGVIDNNGETILETDYDEMVVIPDNTKDLFICTYDVNYETGEYKTKVLNKNGKQIFNNYEGIEAIENYDDNSVWYEKDILKFKNNGKFGLIDFSGKEIVPAEYDKIYAMQGIEKSIIVEKDGLRGLVSNSLGELLIEPKYADIESLGSTYENGYIVKNTEDYYGVVTTDKKEILECKYDKIFNVTSNEFFAVTEAGKNKIIDKTGADILTEGFDEVISIDGDYIVIKKENKYGVIDKTGASQIPCEYDYLVVSFDKVYIAKKGDKFGLVNVGNETLIDFTYENMSYRKATNFIEAEKENFKTDIINGEGKVTLSDVIISSLDTEKGYMRLRVDDNYKYYNFQFEEKKAQDVMPTHTLFLVKENGKYGYENKEGARVVDCIYDDATEQNEYGYVAVKKDGVWGSLKSNGAVCLEPSENLDNNLIIDFIEKWHLDENSNTKIYIK